MLQGVINLLAIARRMTNVRKQLNFQFSDQPPEKLRIGYLSADFRSHAVGNLIAPLFETLRAIKQRLRAQQDQLPLFQPQAWVTALESQLQRLFNRESR